MPVERADFSAYDRARPTKLMNAVDVKIGSLSFDRAEYDAEGDVLYLHIGEPVDAEGEETPESHVLRFAPGTSRIVGLTLIGARAALDREARVTVTLPRTVRISVSEIAPALTDH
jgi:hypothetical protein